MSLLFTDVAAYSQKRNPQKPSTKMYLLCLQTLNTSELWKNMEVQQTPLDTEFMDINSHDYTSHDPLQNLEQELPRSLSPEY